MVKPTNIKLYNYVKSLANKKFKSPSGIYRSAWIVKEYKKRGGIYTGIKNKNTGLTRWFREKWIDLNNHNKKCGSSNTKLYPLCRPTIRITKNTPKIFQELSKRSINNAKKLKKKYTFHKNIRFMV
jgi:hypothetical protein